MPSFLKDYEPVEDRLRAFWEQHPQGRVVTELLYHADGAYIVLARVYRGDELREGPPAATGLARDAVDELDANLKRSALEVCETSAIGRALANLGYAPKGKRPSREEMQKASAASSPAQVTHAAPAVSGRDGAADDVRQAQEKILAEQDRIVAANRGARDAEGEDATQAPQPTPEGGQNEPATGAATQPPTGSPSGPSESTEKSDLTFHPSKPHRMKPAPDFPGYLMCTVGKCAYWEYVGVEAKSG